MQRAKSMSRNHLLRVATLCMGCLIFAHPCAEAADDLSQPIRVSEDGHFLAQPDGKPFFWLGDTAWELFDRLTREETDTYLQDRARKGFNVIQAVATGELDVAGLKTPNRYGEVPFIDANPAKPNPKYFEHIDWVVERAGRHGIRVALLPVWGSFFVSVEKWRAFDVANAESYGRWLGQRYRGKGVIWVLGGDTNPIALAGEGHDGEFSTVTDHRALYDAMARGIAAGEGGDPFMTYHPTAGSPSGTAPPRMSLYFADRNWLDLNLLQSSHAVLGNGEQAGGNYLNTTWFGFVWNAHFNYVPVYDEYRSKPVRPVIDGEPRYEDHPLITGMKTVGTEAMIEATEYWRAHHVRGALYQALFAGAAGHTYGHFTIWNFYDPKRPGQPANGLFDKLFAQFEKVPWQQTLNAPGAGQMRHARALMLSRPYFSRIPDQSLILSEQGTAESHIGATRDRDGTYAMVYLPRGQTVRLDLSKLKGPHVIGWWFDPRTGTAKKLDKRFPTSEQASFAPPTQGEGQDWVLVLDSEGRGFAAPGGAL